MIGRDHLSPAHPVLIFIVGHTHRDDVIDDVITMECGRGLTCKLSPGGRDFYGHVTALDQSGST